MDDNNFWIRFWMLAAMTVISVTIVISLYSYYSDKQMIEAGYTYKRVVGEINPIWVKPEKFTVEKER